MKRIRDPLPGLEARYPDLCPVCHDDIEPGQRIFYRRGRPVHCSCQGGARDER